jgi:hypothetical protein
MGIRFYCPQGHKLNVKEFQAGRRGICPFCGEKILIPTQSSRPSSQEERQARRAGAQAVAAAMASGTSAAPASAEAALPLHPAATAHGELQNAGPAGGAPAADPASVAENVAENNNGPPTAASTATPSAAFFAGGPSKLQDPLTETAEVVWYVRPPTGGQFGPATSEIIRGWLAEGRISADTLVWREGWRDWQEAGGVFPQLNFAFSNPLSALNIPEPLATIPQRAAISIPSAARRTPKSMIWLIVGLGAVTFLVIAAAIGFWLKKG